MLLKRWMYSFIRLKRVILTKYGKVFYIYNVCKHKYYFMFLKAHGRYVIWLEVEQCPYHSSVTQQVTYVGNSAHRISQFSYT